MAYEVQNFEDGQILTAEQLNHMEAGIYANSADMSYEKQNFVDGQKLTAEQLNHMEAGIYANSVSSGSSDSGSTTLPTLNPQGTASDLAYGKKLIDQNGNIVIGVVKEVASGSTHSISGADAAFFDATTYTDPFFRFTAKQTSDNLLRSGSTLSLSAAPSAFGNATINDVVAGKTFTSENGLKLTGTHVCEGSSSNPVIKPLAITANGTYTAPNGVDGYSPITVNVASSGGSSSGESTTAGVAGTASFTLESDASTADTPVKLGNVPWIAEHINDTNLFAALIKKDTASTDKVICVAVGCNSNYFNGKYTISIYKSSYMTWGSEGDLPFNDTTANSRARVCADANGDVYVIPTSDYFFAAAEYALLYGLI